MEQLILLEWTEVIDSLLQATNPVSQIGLMEIMLYHTSGEEGLHLIGFCDGEILVGSGGRFKNA